MTDCRHPLAASLCNVEQLRIGALSRCCARPTQLSNEMERKGFENSNSKMC